MAPQICQLVRTLASQVVFDSVSKGQPEKLLLRTFFIDWVDRAMPELVYPFTMRHAMVLVLLLPGLANAQAAKPSAPEARAVLEEWLAAQNEGNLTRYQRLYAPDFKGVRRSGPREQTFDRDGWLRDRARMFKKPMRVDARDVSIGEGTDGCNTLIFTQGFASGSYADEGRKRIRICRYAEAMLITMEEMLSSGPTIKPALPATVARPPDQAILFEGDFAEQADAKAARRRFRSLLADQPMLHVYQAGQLELPGEVASRVQALGGDAEGWIVLVGACSPAEAGQVAKRLSGIAGIRMVATSRLSTDTCPKPWPGRVETRVTVASGDQRKVEVKAYAGDILPMVSIVLRDENGRALDFVIRDPGQLLDDSTVSDCSLGLAKSRGTVAISYDCEESMQDNCDWGNVSGVSLVRIKDDGIGLEQVKYHRARRPRGCGE